MAVISPVMALRPVASIPRAMSGSVPMGTVHQLSPITGRTNAVLGILGGGDQSNHPQVDYSRYWARFQQSPWYGWLSQQPWFQTWQAQWQQAHPGTPGGTPQPGPPPNQGPDWEHPYSPHPYVHPLLNLLSS